MPRKTSPNQIANLNRGYIKPPKINRSVTIDLHPSAIEEIDLAAKEKGISRSAEIRHRLEIYRKIADSIEPTDR